MLDTKEKVINRIEQLSSLAAALSTAPAVQVLQLRDDLLALPDDGHWSPGGLSGLNFDGSPLQYCISSTRDGWNGRFISDPACIVGKPAQRYSRSYAALQKLYESSGSMAMKQLCEEMLDFHMPVEKEALDEYPDGVLWLGASPDSKGMAVYMDGRRGGHAASWKRLGEWLHHLMPANTEVDDFISNVSKHADIMSIGVEGSNMENVRAKIYFRLRHVAALEDLGVTLLQREEFTDFLNDVVGNKNIQLSGLVFNLGFHIASGKLYDAKIDVCACSSCVALDSREWIQVLAHTSGKYGLVPFPVTSGILDNECAVSYYGVGVTRKGDVRMNLYLKNKVT